MPIRCDYHMHTPLCKHATGPMEAYVERGIELGLKEIGFSDHNPLPGGLGASVRMTEGELEYYVGRVTDLRFQYRGQIDVMLGLEMDYVEGLEDYLTAQIARYPFDYIIGSVHYLDRDCRIGAWTQKYPGTADEQYAQYFTLVRQLARSGLCDILAHLDVVKRSMRPPTPHGAGELNMTLKEVFDAGVAIEINTSGYRHSELAAEPQPYPSLPGIQLAIELGIPLTVNSDAHAPEQVGLKFAEMETFLRQRGLKQLAGFEQRRRTFYDL